MAEARPEPLHGLRPADDTRTASHTSLADRVGWLALGLLLAAYAVVALNHLGGLVWDFDEGINLQQSWLMLDGVRLYDPMWADQPPGYQVLVAWAFDLFGVSVQAARGVTVGFGVVGLFAVAWASRQTLLAMGAARRAAWAGALSASLTLAIAPNFWWASRAAMIGLPTFAMAAWGMAMLLTYSHTRRSRWLALAALGLGLSLWIKLQMIYLGPLMGLVVIGTRWGQWRRLVADLALLAVGSLAPLGLSMLVYDARLMVEQVLVTYFATRDSFQVDLADNLRRAGIWLTSDHWGLAALTLAGVVAILRRPTRPGWIALIWLALAGLTPLQHAPLFLEDHFEPLLFAMTAVGGVAVGVLVAMLDDRRRTTDDGRPMTDDREPTDDGRRPTTDDRPEIVVHGPWSMVRRPSSVVHRLLPLLGVALYLASVPHILAVDWSLRSAREYSNQGDVLIVGSEDWDRLQKRVADMQAAAAFMRDHSQPDDYVLTDHQILAFYGGRRVPPELTALHSRRVGIGALDADYLIAVAERYQPPAMVTWTGQITRFEPFMDWATGKYAPKAKFGSNRRQGYVRAP